MKKNLAHLLRDRTETIEFRSIRKELMAAAQNGQSEYRKRIITQDTIIQLQNAGIRVEHVEQGKNPVYMVYLLSWHLTKEEQLAQKIKWAFDPKERHISVPHGEMDEAMNDPIVNELRGLGVHIQMAIA